jgi:ABC-type branched-subunit amino acid transport system substrate-binding protein
MSGTMKRRVSTVAVVVVTATLAALLTPAVGGASTPTAVTVSNGTITVAGLGYAKNFADAETGARARFDRANADKEVKGYTFDFKEFADDGNLPETALAESRRLVAQDGVDAIVPDLSTVTPNQYLTQQQIPWFGTGYDTTYCTKNSFGFSIYGCIIQDNPKKLPGPNWEQLKKELAAKGLTKPTVALLGTDQNSGKKSVQGSASVAQGAGFNVVYAKGVFPAPPAVVGDYSPYAQALLTSNNGKAPDVVYSTIPATSSLSLFDLMKTSGYTGTFMSPYYSPILLKALQGSYIFVQFAGFEAQTKAIEQMKNDINAVKPNAPGSISLAGGYYAADMFIASVKAALKKSKTLTSASIQKAASTLKYQVKDAIGPTNYPNSYTEQDQACSTLLYDDGSAFKIAQPYRCTTKMYPVLPKFAT